MMQNSTHSALVDFRQYIHIFFQMQ